MINLEKLVGMQILLNSADPDWEYTPSLKTQVAEEIIALPEPDYQKFIGMMPAYSRGVMSKKEAKQHLSKQRRIREGNLIFRNKIIEGFIS